MRKIQKREYILYGVIPWIVIVYTMVTGVLYRNPVFLIPLLFLIILEGVTMEMWVAVYFKGRRLKKHHV